MNRKYNKPSFLIRKENPNKGGSSPLEDVNIEKVNWIKLQGEPISSASAVSPQIERLRKRYEFRDKEEVSGFIKANPQLEPLLFEALEPITAVFPDSQLHLEVFHNQEYQDSNQLVINISTALSVKEALNELDKIDRGWWGSNINRAGGKLTIDLAFE